MTNAGASNGHAPRQGGELEMFDTHCCVVMQQPVSAASSNGTCTSPSQMYCMKQLMTRTPATFSCSLKLSAESSGVELIIQNALLHKLPYLASLQKQKLAEQAGQKKSSSAAETSLKSAFNPPCPMWGLVSLLLLIEKQVQMERWLGHIDSDPALATHTLQMAEYLNCEEQKQAISEWLLTAAKSVSQHNEDSAGEGTNRRSSVSEPPSKRQCNRFTTAQYWHYTRVLKTLPKALCQQVVLSLSESQSRSASAEVAALLPVTLQRTWLASFWPVLDLRAAKLTSMQWTHVLSSILHVEKLVGTDNEGAPAQPLESLHVLLPCDIKDALKNALLGKWQYRKCPTHTLDKHLGQCVKCQSTREANGPIQIIGKCQHPLASISNVSLSDACPSQALEATNVRLAKGLLHGILIGLEGATSMLRLKTLALHDFVVPPQQIPVLGSIFQNLSETLTELYFEHAGANSQVQPWAYRTSDKTALFRAIRMLDNLKILTILYWEDFVGTDTECVEPLLGLQHLETVYVSEVTDSPAFGCGLTFAPVQNALEQ